MRGSLKSSWKMHLYKHTHVFLYIHTYTKLPMDSNCFAPRQTFFFNSIFHELSVVSDIISSQVNHLLLHLFKDSFHYSYSNCSSLCGLQVHLRHFSVQVSPVPSFPHNINRFSTLRILQISIIISHWINKKDLIAKPITSSGVFPINTRDGSASALSTDCTVSQQGGPEPPGTALDSSFAPGLTMQHGEGEEAPRGKSTSELGAECSYHSHAWVLASSPLQHKQERSADNHSQK